MKQPTELTTPGNRLVEHALAAPGTESPAWSTEVLEGSVRIRRQAVRPAARELDPEGYEGELACGAAVTNLHAAADQLGFDATVDWLQTSHLIADVRLRRHEEDDSARSTSSSSARTTFPPKPAAGTHKTIATRELLDDLCTIACSSGLQLAFVQDHECLAQVAELIGRAKALHRVSAITARERYAALRASAAPEQRSEWTELELFCDPRLDAESSTARATVPLLWRMVRSPRAFIRRLRQSWQLSQAACVLYGSHERGLLARAGANFREMTLHIAGERWSWRQHNAPIELALAAHRSTNDAGHSDRHAQMARDIDALFDAPPGMRPLVMFELVPPSAAT